MIVKTTQPIHRQAAPSAALVSATSVISALPLELTAAKTEKGLMVDPITPTPAPTKIIKNPV